MFPQLIAGPIVRYNQIESEIENRDISNKKIFTGAVRVIIGLSKKVIIADNLSYLVKYFLQVNNPSFTKIGGILGIMFYAIQLYYDFSGYSDIAIGLGKIIGLEFEENFTHPFMSRNLSEFWRHWHISLSTWFKDYLFYPILLSKPIKNIRKRLNKINKKFSSLFVDIIALFIVWFTTGVWHGASFNYFLWGMYLGIVMSIEHIFMSCIKIKTSFSKLPIIKIINHLYFIVIIFFSFTIFYFENLADLKIFFSNLLSNNIILSNIMVNQYIQNNIFLIFISLVFLFPISKEVDILLKKLSDNKLLTPIKVNKIKNCLLCVVSMVLLLISTIFIISSTNSPFLYMRF
jgi:alginate O-acetyltransferase complex protein AlgI